jgi:hypothetical protein
MSPDEVSLSNLQIVLGVHRDNCHQVGCPILAALEERAFASEMRTSLPAGERTGMFPGLIAPPPHVLDQAKAVGALRPPGRCVKSHRGAVVFDSASHVVHGWGFNAPPSPMVCAGTERCRKICRRICEHAEARAIDATLRAVNVETLAKDRRVLHLVHVKLGPDDRLTPSGPPSCADCSKRILGCGFIKGVWLFESGNSKTPAWCFYPAVEFHQRSLEAEGLTESTGATP